MQPLRGSLRVFVLTIAASLLVVSAPACSADSRAGAGDDRVATDTSSADVSSNGQQAQAAQSTAFVVPETEAGRVLAAAMAEARATDRLLFVHSGADW